MTTMTGFAKVSASTTASYETLTELHSANLSESFSMRRSTSFDGMSDSEHEKLAAISRVSVNTLKRLRIKMTRGKMKQDGLSESDRERPTSQNRNQYITVKLAHKTVRTYLDQQVCAQLDTGRPTNLTPEALWLKICVGLYRRTLWLHIEHHASLGIKGTIGRTSIVLCMDAFQNEYRKLVPSSGQIEARARW